MSTHKVKIQGDVYEIVDGHLCITFGSDGKTVPQVPSKWDRVDYWVAETRLYRDMAARCAGGVALFGHCSRCLNPIADFVPPDGGMAAGYYVAEAWQKYSNPGEVYICDACMWADARYVADYGPRPMTAPEPEHPTHG